MCHSFGSPSRLEYWHIGETKTRLRNSSPRRLNAENRRLITLPLSVRMSSGNSTPAHTHSTKEPEPVVSSGDLARDEGEEVGGGDGGEVSDERAAAGRGLFPPEGEPEERALGGGGEGLRDGEVGGARRVREERREDEDDDRVGAGREPEPR